MRKTISSRLTEIDGAFYTYSGGRAHTKIVAAALIDPRKATRFRGDVAIKAYQRSRVRVRKLLHIFSIIFLEFPIHPDRDLLFFFIPASNILPACSAGGFLLLDDRL